MKNKYWVPSRVLVDERVKSLPFTRDILKQTKSPAQILSADEMTDYLAHHQPDQYPYGDQILALTFHKGSFLKPCPGTTANYLCCNYQILNTATNCTMSCSYCILKAYYQYSDMTVHANLDNMFNELNKTLRKKSRPFLRIGTGEFTDSLCLDPITRFSLQMVPFFSQAKRAVLELKTKTDEIQNLLTMDPKGKTIVSWSMNSERVSRTEEHGAVSLDRRLKAASQCEHAGYRIGFHFDPIILYEGWEKEYKETVNRIFDSIQDADNIAWISLGCLRFPPALGEIIKMRSPNSKIPYGEFILGNDHKKRYFKPLRIQAFQKMFQWIRNRDPKAVVYLCMESPSVWKAALGRNYQTNIPIARMLSRSVSR